MFLCENERRYTLLNFLFRKLFIFRIGSINIDFKKFPEKGIFLSKHVHQVEEMEANIFFGW